MTVQSGVQCLWLQLGACVGHQRSGHNQVPARGNVSTTTVQGPMFMASDSLKSSLAIVECPRVQKSMVNSGVLHSWEVPCQGVALCGPVQMFHSHAALKCPMVIVLLVALALGHCIVGAAALIPCITMATTSVSLHWSPIMLGGGGCHEEGRVANVGSMPRRGRAQAVCQLWSCVVERARNCQGHYYQSNMFSSIAG